jgi:hypothetical protein
MFLGLPKTGTKFLAVNAYENNKKVAHCDLFVTQKIDRNCKNNLHPFRKINYEYLTQPDFCLDEYISYPQRDHLEYILNNCPDVKYVINKRNVNKWYKSFENTKYTCELFQRMKSHYHDYPHLSKFHDVYNDDDEKIFKEWYNEHYQYVHDTLTKYNASFIYFDIDDYLNNVDELIKFLNFDVLYDIKPTFDDLMNIEKTPLTIIKMANDDNIINNINNIDDINDINNINNINNIRNIDNINNIALDDSKKNEIIT